MSTPDEGRDKYTPATVALIEEAILMGANLTTAASAAGINRSTLFRWQKEIPEFAAMLEQAKGRRAVAWLKVIEAAMVEQWQAAAWKLERSDPKQWGRRVAMQFVDEDGNDLDPARIRDNLITRIDALAESET